MPADLRDWAGEFQAKVREWVASQPPSFAMIWKALLVVAALGIAVTAVTYLWPYIR